MKCTHDNIGDRMVVGWCWAPTPFEDKQCIQLRGAWQKTVPLLPKFQIVPDVFMYRDDCSPVLVESLFCP